MSTRKPDVRDGDAHLKPDDVAKRLRCSTSKVYKLVAQRLIGHVKLGPGKNAPVRFTQGDLDRFIERHRVQPVAAEAS